MTPNQERGMTYCIVPRELAGDLQGQLTEHWLDEPAIRVVVEHRRGERRRDARRLTAGSPSEGAERRKIRSENGRRLADRRALTVPAIAPSLPRRVRSLAERVVFIQRLEPTEYQLRDL